MDVGDKFTYKRKLRSLTERILLINAELVYEKPDILSIENLPCTSYIYGINFKILGSSNKIYNVDIWRSWIQYNEISYSCNCPDFCLRGNTCKHIYWVGSKQFNSMNPEEWDIFDYNRIITDYWITENNADNMGRNSNCPICLENINYETESTICCKNQCHNAIHAICWGRYYDISGNTRCVFCRANTMPYL